MALAGVSRLHFARFNNLVSSAHSSFPVGLNDLGDIAPNPCETCLFVLLTAEKLTSD